MTTTPPTPPAPPANHSPGERTAGNRLRQESSAYLRQHQDNPVDWYAWGPEALERARAEDKPILVSIGYSACHWCHVMERESFEDPAVAERMNEAFINIKVDREERPDLDQIYMDASLKLNGQGGWPLNAICTPDGQPFFVGTYFPPQSRGGSPSWTEVIEALSGAWRERQSEVLENAGQIARALVERPASDDGSAPGPESVRRGARALMQNADLRHGGFGDAPKFPAPANLDFLITALDFIEPEEAKAAAQFLAMTAREMSRRGLYDQIGAGFHRYCTDANWTIPHFEKMLYDQGQLLAFYAELARRSHEASDLIWPIQETVEYLRREMRAESGAFYASQDADSEGVEGRFFVWTPNEIENALGSESEAFALAYGIRPAGNFELGTTHLVDEARQKRSQFADQRAALLAARASRVAPNTDRKHVAAWNGYLISGLARSASLLSDASILSDAVQCADFVLTQMRDASGRLLRIHDEGRAHIRGFLDDYAGLLIGCLDLHRAGAGHRFFEAAESLANDILADFADLKTGELFLTAADADPLIHRPRPEHDGAAPDAAGLALLGLIRIAGLSHSVRIEHFIETALRGVSGDLERMPQAFPTTLRALALRLRGLSVAVIVGPESAPETQALASRARRVLRPDDAILVIDPEDAEAGRSPAGIDAQWIAGRVQIEDRPTAYVCRGQACSLPVHEPAQLIAELEIDPAN